MARENQRQVPGSGPTPGATEREIGFGNKVYGRRLRLINPSGRTNVKRRGRGIFRPYDLYHQLITMPWSHLLGIIVASYLGINILFSFAYLGVGMDSLSGVTGTTWLEHFLDAFFFSAQTITTLGYGRIAPVGAAASTIAAIESMLGLLGFAIATGLLYGRFSRPVARIKFSETGIIAPYKDYTAFMFRMANERDSELVEAEVQVMLTLVSPELGKRTFVSLELEISKINLFALPWTIVHPITPESPLYGRDAKYLEEVDVEFIVMLKAFDEAFGATVYQRQSFKFWEVEFGRKFIPITEPEGEHVAMDLKRIGATESAELPKQ